MARIAVASLCFLAATAVPTLALAVASAEVYTGTAYGYGRVEARIRFAAGDGIISSFFLWKDGSEAPGTFWNELDFEKLGADCHVETNAIYGNPSANHIQKHTTLADPCGTFHTYAYEWTPDAIAWLVDGVELRRDTGANAAAFAQNAAGGMQIHFNVWPGDVTFGGNFNPSVLPVHQYVDWVQFSSFKDGAFTLAWREDLGGALPSGWLTGSWGSPKNQSTHDPRNVNFLDGFLVLSLTADGAVGPAGAAPGAPSENGGGGSGGSRSGTAGTSSSGGASGGGGGASSSGAEGPGAGSPGSSGSVSASGQPSTTAGGTPASSGGAPSTGGSPGAAGLPSSAGNGPSPSASGTSAATSPPSGSGCSLSDHRNGEAGGLLFSALALVASAARRRRR